jgi:hypothetical protein
LQDRYPLSCRQIGSLAVLQLSSLVVINAYLMLSSTAAAKSDKESSWTIALIRALDTDEIHARKRIVNGIHALRWDIGPHQSHVTLVLVVHMVHRRLGLTSASVRLGIF